MNLAAATPPTPFINTSDKAPAFWQNDALWVVLAAAEQTRGMFTMLEQLMPEKNGPPPHVHERLYEIFYILEGEITFQLGTELVTAGTGAAVWIPPGTPHGFRVKTETARALNMYLPGGFDDVSLLGTPATARTLPPAGAIKEASTEQNEAFIRRIREMHTQSWADVPNLLKEDK